VDKKLSKKYTQKYLEYTEKVENILKEIFKNGVNSAMNKFN
jgi:diadenosine tetraphosphate (Ap4A) HIT family hydrolase